jgi:hypothetical protein
MMAGAVASGVFVIQTIVWLIKEPSNPAYWGFFWTNLLFLVGAALTYLAFVREAERYLPKHLREEPLKEEATETSALLPSATA